MSLVRRALPRRLTALAVATLAAAGCSAATSDGSSPTAGKSPKEILADATAALKGVTSVHIKGPLAGTGGSATLLDMRYAGTRGASGSLIVQGQTIRIIRIGTRLYVQGAAALFGPSFGQQVGTRWAALSTTGAVGSSLAQVTNLNTVAGQILTPVGTLQPTVGQATVGGRKALLLTDGAAGTSIWVSATGAPVPLQERTAASATMTVTFGSYDAPMSLSAPAGAVTVAGLS